MEYGPRILLLNSSDGKSETPSRLCSLWECYPARAPRPLPWFCLAWKSGKTLERPVANQTLDQTSSNHGHVWWLTSAHSCHLAPTGPTTSTTCSAYHTLRLTRLASKFVFIHLRLPSDRPFPLHGLVSPLVLPQSSPAEDTQIAQVPTPQVRAGSRNPSPHVAHDPSQFGPRSGPYLC